MNSSESAVGTTDEVDGTGLGDRFGAALAFCKAAAAAHRIGDAPERRHLAEEQLEAAGRALTALADFEGEDALHVALRPDPAIEHALWTVACYQVGDLIPCDLEDFQDPVRAVLALASCDDASHVAAELIASTSSGVRWTALVRVGERISFQLPSADSASSGSGAQAGALDLALENWASRLAEWRRPGPQPLGVSREPAFRSGSEPSDSSVAALLTNMSELRAAMARQEERLEAIEHRLTSLLDLLRSATLSRGDLLDEPAAPGSLDQ